MDVLKALGVKPPTAEQVDAEIERVGLDGLAESDRATIRALMPELLLLQDKRRKAADIILQGNHYDDLALQLVIIQQNWVVIRLLNEIAKKLDTQGVTGAPARDAL